MFQKVEGEGVSRPFEIFVGRWSGRGLGGSLGEVEGRGGGGVGGLRRFEAHV